jgi:hypothetical protein
LKEDPKYLRDLFRRLHQARKRFLRDNARLRVRRAETSFVTPEVCERFQKAMQAGHAFGERCRDRMPEGIEERAIEGADDQYDLGEPKPIWAALSGAFYFGAASAIIGAKMASEETFTRATRWKARGRQFLGRALVSFSLEDRMTFRAFGEDSPIIRRNAIGQSLALATLIDGLVAENMHVHLPHTRWLIDCLDLFAVWPGHLDGYGIKVFWTEGSSVRIEPRVATFGRELPEFERNLMRHVARINNRFAVDWIPTVATVGVYEPRPAISPAPSLTVLTTQQVLTPQPLFQVA